MFLIAQDSTGGRAFTWPSGWTNMPPVTRTASAVTAVEALFDGTTAYPVAPGSNLKLQVDDKTINAGFFAGASNALRVNAAIAYAVANSFTAVRVPANLLPYDASAVTFNTGVHMLAEGCHQGLDSRDPVAYGGAGDNSTDDTVAVQAALDACAAATGISGCRKIRFSKLHKTTAPIYVKGHGLIMEGAGAGYGSERQTGLGYGATGIRATGFYAPMIWVERDDIAAGNITTGLVGGGNAFDFRTNAQNNFSLNDLRYADLDGLSQFCVRCFINLANGSGNWGAISASSVTPLPGLAASSCYQLFIDSSLKANFNLTVGGVNKTLIASAVALNDGVTHHLAGTYDGSTIRLFVDGILRASTAATGSLTQTPLECVTLGSQNSQPAEQDRSLNAFGGIVDSLELRDTATYTTGFTPPTIKHTQDVNTLALLNADQQVGPRTVVHSKNYDGWARWYSVFGESTAGATGCVFRDFHLIASDNQPGIFLGHETEFSQFSSLTFGGVRYGIYGPHGNHFHWSARNIFLNDGLKSIFGIGMGLNGGDGHLDTCWFFGTRVPVILRSSGDTTIENLHWVTATGGKAYAGLVCVHAEVINSAFRIINFTMDTEAGADASLHAGIMLGGGGVTTPGGSVSVEGSAFLMRGGAYYAIISGTNAVEFRETQFQTADGLNPASVMQVVTAPVQPVLFTGCQQKSGAWVPWSGTPGTATVGKLGKLTAIAFATPLTLDCSLRDDFELGALTGAITINFSNVTPGQKISLWTVQNAGGGNSITFGTVNTTGAVKGATANDTTGNHYSQYLFDANLSGNLTQVGFSSGA